MTNTTRVGRLAMRQEGSIWTAYYAQENTMDGALFLGSIAVSAVADNKEREETFIKLMKDIVGDIIEQTTKVRPMWDEPQEAPEHEKAGIA